MNEIGIGVCTMCGTYTIEDDLCDNCRPLTEVREPCPLCHGWGELEGYAGVAKMTCFKCKGTGREKNKPTAQ